MTIRLDDSWESDKNRAVESKDQGIPARKRVVPDPGGPESKGRRSGSCHSPDAHSTPGSEQSVRLSSLWDLPLHR